MDPVKLDIRDFKQTTRQELHDAIEEAVGEFASSAFQVELPSVLVMTKDQFDILKSDMEKSYMPPVLEGAELREATDRIYMTKHNVMEVDIPGYVQPKDDPDFQSLLLP